MLLHTRSAGSGVPVVLLHAFPLSSAMWHAQREELSSRYRVITPDMRGFGESPLGDDPPSIDLMADDVARLLDAEGVDRAVVGGQSMGGYVTMAFCRRHADRLLGVVLADTKAGADPPQAALNREAMAAAVLEHGTSVLSEQVLPNLVGETTKTGRAMVFGRVRALTSVAPPRAVAWAQRAMAARPDSFGTLRALQVPALVVVGEEDGLTPPAEARAMAEALPYGSLAVIARAGHLSALEQPEAFNRALVEFLGGLRAR
ncbi:alpha/beta fold hydrolase [Sinosporangium siamense]|uniref:Alpha/beta hydrolase n=1 Tax=Sinosporangium siamense TaxID=1367973 RepID=A0A919RD76_9ACTN|nr:alpha/beta fold hydrolase [Sinosporangium siamense]GII91287.1 alpha/beta hydrolase [Sinosporangium siamense]